MAYQEIVKYALVYKDRPGIYVSVDGSSYHLILPDPSHGVFVADMLRNERPMYVDLATRTLSTSGEEVGEEET